MLAPPVPFGHHHLHLRVRTVCRSAYAQELLPLDSELPGPFNLSSYDHDGRVQTGAVHRLSENKYKLRQAFEVRCFGGFPSLHPYIEWCQCTTVLSPWQKYSTTLVTAGRQQYL